MSKSTFYYKSVKKEDPVLCEKIKQIAYKYPFYGYRKIHVHLKREKININHKKVYRLYTTLNLQKSSSKKKKHLPKKSSEYELKTASYPNHFWALDFCHISLANRKSYKILTVEDIYSRKGIEAAYNTSIPSESVIQILQSLISKYGKPTAIRTDNGGEFISNHIKQFLSKERIYHDLIPKGSPFFNGNLERFNGSLKQECIFLEYIENEKELESIINEYLIFYNTQRPHQALNYSVPDDFYYQEKEQKQKCSNHCFSTQNNGLT